MNKRSLAIVFFALTQFVQAQTTVLIEGHPYDSITGAPIVQILGGGGTTTIGSTVGLVSGVATIGSVNVLGGNATALKVDGSASIQPITASSLPLPTGASTSAQSIANTIAITTSLATANTSIQSVKTALGSPLQAGGSVTATIAGTPNVAITSSVLPVGSATSANQPSINADGGSLSHVTNFPSTQVVSGSVTANAGTNLNTSALALESGGNLASIKASLGSSVIQSTGGTVGLVAGSATIGSVNILGGNTSAVKVDNSAVTQPVSASTLPLPTGAATSALQSTGNTALTTINTTLGSPIQTTGGTVGLVTGTASIGSISNTGFTASQATAANLNATVVGTGTLSVQNTAAVVGGNSVAIKVDGSAVTQPVSGTVTATQATAANLNATIVGTGTLSVQNTAATVAGTNSIGTVGLNAGANAIGSITNTSFIATQATAANFNSTVTQATGNWNSNTAQVNGVTVNAGIGASSTGTQRVAVSNDSKVQPWDGVNTVTVKAASTAPAATDTALVVTVSPNSPSSVGRGTYTLAAPTLTTGSISTIQLDVNGNQLANIVNTVGANIAQVGGSTVVTAATGVQKVGVVGNSGTTLDSASGTANAQAVTIQGNTGGIAVPVQIVSATSPTQATFSAITSTLILASSTARKALSIFNDYGSGQTLYLLAGTGTVSSTNYTYALVAGGVFVAQPQEVGYAWTGIYAATPTKSAQVTSGQ